MRRQRHFLQAFFALVVFCLAANVRAGETRSDFGSAFDSMHGEPAAVLAPHATVGRVATSKTASPSDWASRLFLPGRRLVVRHHGLAAPSAFALSGIRDRESLTFTYDATAPPAATLNTVG
ncbi:MAG: hypothetical protein ACJ8AD_07015 [Gemmatimonadaceae bacterium]